MPIKHHNELPQSITHEILRELETLNDKIEKPEYGSCTDAMLTLCWLKIGCIYSFWFEGQLNPRGQYISRDWEPGHYLFSDSPLAKYQGVETMKVGAKTTSGGFMELSIFTVGANGITPTQDSVLYQSTVDLQFTFILSEE